MPTDPLIEQPASRQPGWKKAVVVALIFAMSGLGQVSVGWSQTAGSPPAEDTTQGTLSGAGLQAASFLLTLPYGAVKVAFAILGGVVGGLTYALSGGNSEAAKSVWTTSVYGTYVITPDHLKGDKAVRFFGVPAESDESALPAETVPAMPEPTKK